MQTNTNKVRSRWLRSETFIVLINEQLGGREKIHVCMILQTFFFSLWC